jgi:hypothetical protein
MPSRQFFSDIQLGSDNLLIAFGAGTPESSQTADVSSLYVRSDATDSATSLYVKNSGTGDTGWLPVAVIPSGATEGRIPFIAADGNLTTEGVGDLYWDATDDHLGINTDDPQAAIHVFDDGTTTSRLIFQTTNTANAPGVQLQWDGTGTRRVLMRGVTVGTLGAAIEFYAKPDSATTVSHYMTVEADGGVTVEVGDLFIPNMTAATDTNIVYFDTSTGQLTYGAPPSASIDGSGDANRIAIWSDTDTLTSAAGFTYTGGQFILPTGSEIGIGEPTPDSVLHATGAFTPTTGKFKLESTLTNNLSFEMTWDASGFKRVFVEGAQSGSLGAELRFYAKPDAASVADLYMTIQDDGDIVVHEGDILVPNMTAATDTNIVYYDTATGQLTYGIPTSASIDGSGATNQVAYWSDSDTLTGASDFLFDGSVLTVPSDSTVGNLSITFDGDTNTGIQGGGSDQIYIRANAQTVAVFSYNVSATQTQLSGNVLVSDGHVNINDQFELQLQEDVANGNAYVALRAAADMTAASGTYTLTLPAETPSDGEVLQWNASNSDFDWAPIIGGANSGSAQRIAYWSGSNTLTSEAGFGYNPTTNTINVTTVNTSLGSAAAPAIAFQTDQDTGMFQNGADILGFSSGGTLVAEIDNVSTDKGFILKQTGHKFLAPEPTILTNPTYSFVADPASGFGRFQSGGFLGWSAIVNNTNVFYAFSSGGSNFIFMIANAGLNLSVTPLNLTSGSQFRADNSLTAANPAIVFSSSETDTGIYRSAAHHIGFSGQGTQWINLDGVNNDFEMLAESTISFGDSDSSDFVSLKAPATLSASYTLEFPASAPADGEVLEWSSGSSAFVWATPSGGGGSGEAVQFDLTQASPTLALLDAVYHDGTNWQKAQADDPSTLGTHVIISKSGNDYEVCQAGRVTVSSHGLTVGEYYFTSSVTAGLLTATEPNQYSNPLVYVEDANTLHILPFRPSAINGEFVPTYVKTIGIETPSSSENIALFFTDDAITITQVNDVCRGTTPSVTWNIAHATTRNNGTPNELFSSDRVTTSLTGAETTTFNDATIPAGSWVWLTTSATSGTVDEFTVSLEYTRD